MAYSLIGVEFRLPTTSYLRISDAVQAINDVVKEHRGVDFFVMVKGPYETEESENVIDSSSGSRGPELGRSSPPAGNDGSRPEPVKRRPGRPRKAEAGPAPESRQSLSTGAAQEAAARGGAEAPIEHVARGPDTRFVKGSGEGQERRGGDGRGGSDQRGAGAPDRLVEPPLDPGWDYEPETKAAGEEPTFDDWADSPVEPQDFDEEWHAKSPGDEWPASLMPAGLNPQTLDRTAINTLLGDHFRVCGDKTRETTLAVVEKATGQRSVGQVPPEDYWKLARCIIKDTKRYEYGLIKPKG